MIEGEFWMFYSYIVFYLNVGLFEFFECICVVE